MVAANNVTLILNVNLRMEMGEGHTLALTRFTQEAVYNQDTHAQPRESLLNVFLNVIVNKLRFRHA